MPTYMNNTSPFSSNINNDMRYCVFGSFTIAETLAILRQIAIQDLKITQKQRACKRCGRLCHTEIKCYARISVTGEDLPPVENVLKFTETDVRHWIAAERIAYFQKETMRDRTTIVVDMEVEMALRHSYIVTDNLLYDHAEKCIINQINQY